LQRNPGAWQALGEVPAPISVLDNPQHVVIATKYEKRHTDNLKVKAKHDKEENSVFTEKVREEAARAIRVENLEDLREKVCELRILHIGIELAG